MRDGQRICFPEVDGRKDEFNHTDFAETIAFQVASCLFECPLNEYEGNVYLERFYEIPWWRFLAKVT